MLVKDDFKSYQTYILQYIVERDRKNFVSKLFNNKKKLKKILHNNIFSTIINKKMIYDFIYSYFFHPYIKFQNAVPYINSNICSLNVFHQDADLKISVNQKQDVHTIYITFSSNKINIPITINLNYELKYNGDMERNELIVYESNNILQFIMYQYLSIQVDIAFEEEKRGILKCIK